MNSLFAKFAVKAEAPLREDEYRNAEGILMCSHCHTPRQAMVPIGEEVRIVRAICNCQAEKREKEKAERKARELLDTIARNRSIGLTDPGMGKHTFAADKGYNPEEMAVARNYVKNWEEERMKSHGLLIWGDVGTGKSYIADCIGNALLDQGVPVLITNFSRLMNRLSDLHNGDRNGFIDSLNCFDLLILDDMGVERDSEFAQEQCFNIVDSRYRSGLPMIVTTNLSLPEMKTEVNLGKRRIYDRVLEHSIPLLVTKQNIRKLNAQQTIKDAQKLLST